MEILIYFITRMIMLGCISVILSETIPFANKSIHHKYNG